jgi:hypothetical protein
MPRRKYDARVYELAKRGAEVGVIEFASCARPSRSYSSPR